MKTKFESLNSRKMDLTNVVGGLSQEAANALNNLQWLTRTNVHMGATDHTPANIAIGNDPFGDLSMDSNAPQGG
ncbi:MAG: hypothetical protein IT222_01035 [Crocinitomix sp.]|nr:hypothetical protein [Crocinitomix sp.]